MGLMGPLTPMGSMERLHLIIWAPFIMPTVSYKGPRLPGLALAYFIFCLDKVAKYEFGHETDRQGHYRRKNTGKFDVFAT